MAAKGRIQPFKGPFTPSAKKGITEARQGLLNLYSVINASQRKHCNPNIIKNNTTAYCCNCPHTLSKRLALTG